MATPYPDHPQLRGNFAPLRMECDLDDVIIDGEMPRNLDVTFYRNGPDPQYPPRGRHHWFAGDGMVHMFRIRDGRVAYRNRWARTVKWQLERQAGVSLFSPFDPTSADASVAEVDTDGLANTSVVWHGGKLLALEEGHAPFELDPRTLDSRGPWRFGGALSGPMTAHPKTDPDTGEMLFFGYAADGPLTPGMAYHVVDASGRLVRSESFEAPFASMVHDFIVTSEHVVFPIFPLTGSLERATSGEPPYAWEPDLGTRVGVMRRDGSTRDMRWYETGPCYVFHPLNAYSDGNRVVAHVMQFERPPLFPDAGHSAADPEPAHARLAEWVIDLDDGGGLSRRYLDDLHGEFPRLDERRAGQRCRHGYYAAATMAGDGLGFDAIAHHDFARGGARLFRLGDGDTTGEPVFVPRAPGAPEGDGYLLALVYRGAENRSDLLVLDAADVEAGPVAAARLPHRVPYGFHGNWRYND